MNRKKYVIIGASAAGLSAARTLRTLEKDACIICISDEQENPYNKCFLADYVAGDKTQEQVFTIHAQQTDALHIDMRLNTKIVGIFPEERMIVCSDGVQVSYDKLLLATGRRPRALPFFQHAYANLFYFHTLGQADQLLAYAKKYLPSRAVVIGAGLSGIEIADALNQKGIQVHIVERSGQLLNYHLTLEGSKVLQAVMERAGGVVHLQKNIVSFETYANPDMITHIALDDGTYIAVDMIVVAVGSVQNNELAHAAEISCDQHGVVVNDYMQTSQGYIYAAGDLISIVDMLSGNRMASCTWPDAMQQGRYAAYGMAGQPKAYPGAAIITSSAFFGLKFYSCGPKEGADYRIIEEMTDTSYTRYIMSNEVLTGFILLGDGKQFTQLKRALLTGEPLSL